MNRSIGGQRVTPINLEMTIENAIALGSPAGTIDLFVSKTTMATLYGAKLHGLLLPEIEC